MLKKKMELAIDAVNFPDANFRSIVTENYDTDKDGNLSDTEIAAVEKLIVLIKVSAV